MVYHFSNCAIRMAVYAALLGQSGVAAASRSSADEPTISVPSKCRFSKSSDVIPSLKDALGLADEVRRLGLDIADVGEPYRPFDVIDNSNRTLPNRKFVRAYRFDDRIIAWYIRGGFVTSWHIVEFKYQSDHQGNSPVLRATGKALSGRPCEATQALLNGVVSAQGW